jgi:hypothetical protein
MVVRQCVIILANINLFIKYNFYFIINDVILNVLLYCIYSLISIRWFYFLLFLLIWTILFIKLTL